MEDRSKDEFRRNRAEEASHKHGDPSHSLKVFGITGTNGKTTSTFLVECLMRAAGERCGVIGTVENRFESWREDAKLTTPGPDDFQKLLANYRSMGATAVACEVSSHGLDQFRVWPTRFTGVVMTNLTQDHLDYHGSMENYFAAKRRLFLEYETKARVLNADDPWCLRLAKECQMQGFPVITFGKSNGDLRYENLLLSATGIRGSLRGTWNRKPVAIELDSPLVGEFNAKNLTQTAALGVMLGLPAETISQGLNACSGVPGRLEGIQEANPRGFGVFVDYAHTPDALEKAIKALKPFCTGKLSVLFGCGGDRDPGKRPIMGAIAEREADRVFITSDNPRTEPPQAIIDQILAGLKNPAAAQVYADRRLAISAAIASLRPQDMLLIAGKGHETYQIVGTEVRPFDDRVVAREALFELR